MEKNENGYYTDSADNSYNMGIRAENSVRQLAMVYSPYQCWRRLYDEEAALAHGTLFEELYKPLEDGCV